MNSNDKTNTTYELNHNIDEVTIYSLFTGRDVTGTFHPAAADGKGLVGFWLEISAEVDDLFDRYRQGVLTVEPRRFARLIGELHRRAGRIERAARKAEEVQQ
jgi:hypothetical protein